MNNNSIVLLEVRCARLIVIVLVTAFCVFVMSAGIASDYNASPQKTTSSTATANHSENIKYYKISDRYYPIPSLSFISNTGKQVQIESLLSLPHPVMLQFIYTTCTTICPVLSATFSQIQDQLSKIDGNSLLISISIDPEHDNSQKISQYAKRYNANPNWVFLTENSNTVKSLLKSFDVLYPGSNKMNHLSTIFFREHPNMPWRRIDGFLSADELMTEYFEFHALFCVSH